jgi:membrane-bound lytic murein transglycosylase B
MRAAINRLQGRFIDSESTMSKINASAIVCVAFAGAAMLATASPALAAKCNPPGGFSAFITEFKKEAVAKGISRKGLAALDGLTVDDKVLAADRRQHVFKQSFEQFSGRMISQDRMKKGTFQLLKNASLISRIEDRFGVPGAVIVAIWGLETDFGVNQGKMSVVRSTATLAFDCRRSDKFQDELMNALRILDRGDLTNAEMRGDWAGEIGQTQFLPSSYMKYAVSYSGRGKPDLISNKSDVLASTANYLAQHGWQRGKGWSPGEPNFEVIKTWNKAEVYAKTIALFAVKLDRASNSRAKAQ